MFWGRSRKRSGFPLQVLAEAVGFPLQSLTCKCVFIYITFFFHLLPPTRQRYRSVPASPFPFKHSGRLHARRETQSRAGQTEHIRPCCPPELRLPSKLCVRHPVRISSPDVCPGSPLLSYPFFQPLFSSFWALP